ncbi:MAG: ATP-binding protein [Treponema sp.]|nr:ATP-binding protein [Treponema sp.]
MKRYALEELNNWRNSVNRKPLLLYGARQVGKTWLVRNFAEVYYDDLIELNFFTDDTLKKIFNENVSPEYIIQQLELRFNKKIDPLRTLIFFDEIQESQRAMDSLKAFNDAQNSKKFPAQNATKFPAQAESGHNYNIIAAGSFLGIMLGRRPVGQTDQITLYPMSFCEFLEALGKDMLADAINRFDTAGISGVSNLLEALLKQYYYVGGMPAAVSEYAASGDLVKVREIQNELISSYKGDFSKHISDPRTEPKIRMLWDSISLHLVKENKKFIYKNVKSGGRAAEFENAMQWLVDTGLVYKINKVETPKLPLKMHYKEEFFKLYMLDIGLLGAQAEVRAADIFAAGADIVDDMNGALAEQFVCQELKTAKISPLFYWGRSHSTAEVDFLIQGNNEIIPIEVKSSKHTKSQSLKVYVQEYNPKHTIRTSLKNYGVIQSLHSIPLYMISQGVRQLIM